MDLLDEKAHDFSLTGLDGAVHTLTETLRDSQNLLLIFLRHLG